MKNNNDSKKALLPIAIFAAMGAVVLLTASFAGTNQPTFSVADTNLTGLEAVNDSDASDGVSIVFGESNDPDPPIDPPTGAITPIPKQDPAKTTTNVVDAGCTPAPADCMAKINSALTANKTRPIKVTFGANHSAGTEFRFSTRLKVEDNITLAGATNSGNGRPVAALHAPNQIFVITGKKNLSFTNFDIDAVQGKNTETIFASVGVGPTNIHITDMRAFNGSSVNGDQKTSWFYYSRSNGGDGLFMRNVEVENFHRGVFQNINSSGVYKNVYIQESKFSDYYNSAIKFDKATLNTYIENSEFKYHSIKVCGARDSNGKNSNPIGFQPNQRNGNLLHNGVYFRNNVVYGRPGATASDCGGSGDLIAFRGTKDFIIENNQFLDSGEVGLTATAGLEDGVIRYNTVLRSDFSGIQIGNPTTGYTPVKNVSIYGNHVESAGIDVDKRTGTANHTKPHVPYTLPAIAALNVDRICISNNLVRAITDQGIWLHDGMTAAGKKGVGRFQPQAGPVYISGNDVANSERGLGGKDKGKIMNYSQSGIPSQSTNFVNYPYLSDFYVAGETTAYYNTEYGVGYGQEPWEYGNSLSVTDKDNDGFHAGCFGESNDNNPCIPDAKAAACKQ